MSLVTRFGNRFLLSGNSKLRKQLINLEHLKRFNYVISKSNMGDGVYATVSYITVPDRQVARTVAEGLVKERLAACVNIVNSVESHYEWEGKLTKSEELLLIIKSTSKKTQSIVEFASKNIPYTCPEIITVKIESGSEKYINWVSETVEKEALE